MYLTYEEYRMMGGELEQAAFYINLHKAEAEINKQTYGRLCNKTEIPEEVSYCVFELVGIYDEQSESMSSASNDGVSANYTVKDYAKELSETVKRYLSHVCTDDGTPLLYMGVD